MEKRTIFLELSTEMIDKIEAEDDYTFRIVLKHPFAPLLCRLGWPIAPKHLLEGSDLLNTSFNRRPVGSGPFKLVDWTEDDTIALDANREYFQNGRPILDKLIFNWYGTIRGLRFIAKIRSDDFVAFHLRIDNAKMGFIADGDLAGQIDHDV